MSGPIELEDGAIVRVSPPVLPVVQAAPPGTEAVHALPVIGPQGPPGPTADGALILDLINDALAGHIADATPHPAYDLDLEDLANLFQNRIS